MLGWGWESSTGTAWLWDGNQSEPPCAPVTLFSYPIRLIYFDYTLAEAELAVASHPQQSAAITAVAAGAHSGINDTDQCWS